MVIRWLVVVVVVALVVWLNWARLRGVFDTFIR